MDNLEYNGIGIVTKHDDLYDKEIQVYPLEMLPTNTSMFDKDIPLKSTMEDLSAPGGAPSPDHSSTFPATYWNVNNPNRITVPNVEVGERVLLFKYKNTDAYLWMPDSLDYDKPTYRTQEHIEFRISNNTDRNDDHLGGYILTVSSRDKNLSLTTDTHNNEATNYDLNIDLAKGVITVKDGHDNHIILESTKQQLSIKTNFVYVDAPDSQFTGNVEIDGNLVVHKNTSTDQNTSTGDNLSVGGSSKVSGNSSSGSRSGGPI